MLNSNIHYRLALRRARTSGFSLIELMVTLAVFLVISGAAFNLVNKHVPVFTAQQNQVGLNLTLRNAAAQLQIDTANAGSGFYPTADVTSWPIPVTIAPGSDDATDCYNSSTHTYSQQCFDSINVLRADTSTPPAQIGKENPSHDDCEPNDNSIAQSSTLFVQPVAPMTVTTLANSYHVGDQFLIISSKSNKIGTIILTGVGTTGTGVKLSHTKNVQTAENDHYLISTKSTNKLETNFCKGDWVVKLNPAVYVVDTSDSSNPKLVRLQPNDANCLPTSTAPYNYSCVVAEQVIGFKVGAQIFDPDSSSDPNDCNPFCYKPASYSTDWSQIRGVRITIIGRTTPKPGPGAYYNTFDKGPYKIDAISIVVSPRSLSMRDES